MTFLNMDAMSVASNCSIIYYPPRGVFFLFKLEGCALKVGGVNPPYGGSRNIPADYAADWRPLIAAVSPHVMFRTH